MDDRTLDAYLARIGATRASTLVELHELHLAAVPFENLSIHLGEAIVLDEDLLVDKIVNRRRGGFCYELNGAFAALLRALGHDVRILSAKVFNDGAYGPPFDHMALRVGDPAGRRRLRAVQPAAVGPGQPGGPARSRRCVPDGRHAGG